MAIKKCSIQTSDCHLASNGIQRNGIKFTKSDDHYKDPTKNKAQPFKKSLEFTAKISQIYNI